MEKSKVYKNARFAVETIRQAIELFQIETETSDKPPRTEIEVSGETWRHDNLDEFFADYRRSNNGDFSVSILDGSKQFSIYSILGSTKITVAADSRSKIEKLFSVFENNYPNCVVIPPEPEVTPPTVFIGHGRAALWRDLKDHLQDKHGYEVVAYETGARAGHTIRDILDEMASRSSIAFLVFTGEDEQPDGKFRARQNVIHETGLFQGRLGFSRAIALIENGVEPFSNLQGIEQIRFTNIKETFGEVLATIKRESE